METDGLYLIFDEHQQGIALGQFVAWYQGEELISFLEMKNEMVYNQEYDEVLSDYSLFFEKRAKVRTRSFGFGT